MPDGSNLTQLVEADLAKLGNMSCHGQFRVQENAKIPGGLVGDQCPREVSKRHEIPFWELLASSEPDKLRLVMIQTQAVRRHPIRHGADRSLHACSQGERVIRIAAPVELGVIGIEVNSQAQ